MPTKKPVSKKAKTLADFANAHDKNVIVPKKIKDALDKLGKDGWEYEPEFMRLAGVSVTDFARFREQFEAFYVVVGGSKSSKRVWAGTAATASAMREMV